MFNKLLHFLGWYKRYDDTRIKARLRERFEDYGFGFDVGELLLADIVRIVRGQQGD